MPRLRELARWSTRRVIWACVLWLIGAPVAGAVGLILAGLVLAGLSGKNPVGVSAHISNLVLGWLFLPPVLLVAAWIWAKGRRSHSTPDESGSE
jgi:hypothetical protein